MIEPAMLYRTLQQTNLLAQGIQALGNHFQSSDGSSGVRGVVIVLAVAVAVVLVTWLAARYANPPGPFRSPGRLFRELCGAHELTVKERRLLRKLAKRHHVSPPEVFVQPHFFNLPDENESTDNPLREQVASLKERLFGAV